RTTLVGLDDNAQCPSLAGGSLRHEVFQRDSTTGSAPTLRLAIESLSTLRHLSRGGRVLDDDQLVAGHRHALETQHLNRGCRTGILHTFAALVEEGTNAAG